MLAILLGQVEEVFWEDPLVPTWYNVSKGFRFDIECMSWRAAQLSPIRKNRKRINAIGQKIPERKE